VSTGDTIRVQEAMLAPSATQSSAVPRTIDERTFHDVYRQTARPLWSYIRRVIGNAAEADDILQETFMRLLRHPVATTEPHELRALAYRIASNLMVDHWRRTRRAKPAEASGERPRSDGAAEADLRYDMQRTFAELGPQERALLWLAYVEGSAHREIAQALGVKEPSVRVLLFRARHKLARLLRDRGFGSGGSAAARGR
jgi:RNA polymerase sigma-70 factor (ECF subfamily)